MEELQERNMVMEKTLTNIQDSTQQIAQMQQLHMQVVNIAEKILVLLDTNN